LTKNKKILIVTECFYPEEFKINDVALAWKDKGYDVDVLTLVPSYPLGKVFDGYKNNLFGKDTYHGINIFRVSTVTGYRDSKVKKILKYINFMLLGSVVSALIGRKYDYVFGFNMSSLTGMLPAVVVRKLYKTPLMFWSQDLWPDSVYAYGFKKTKLLQVTLDVFVRFMYRNISAIAISGKGFESKLKPYVHSDLKFHYLPNWADELNMELDPAILSVEKKVHFTFAGNVGKVQNLDNILRAFCLLSDEYQSDSQMNIIGDGSNLNNLKSLTSKNTNIVFHGKQKREHMARYYKASDFLIVSLIDNPIFSLTVPAKTQTYIAAKKPILAIINGDTADIIKENNLGLHAEPSNIDAISKLFEECIDMDDHKKSEYTDNCDCLLQTTFNKTRIINKMTEVLTGIPSLQ
jgi:glycosyltransferase involved in cell wall biosynthesis